MSREARDWAWSIKLPPTAKYVLIALSEFANPQGLCWPSLTKLQQRTCLSRRAITDSLNFLEEAGAISRVRGGPGKTTRYTLQLECSALRAADALHKARDALHVGQQMPRNRQENRQKTAISPIQGGESPCTELNHGVAAPDSYPGPERIIDGGATANISGDTP